MKFFKTKGRNLLTSTERYFFYLGRTIHIITSVLFVIEFHSYPTYVDPDVHKTCSRDGCLYYTYTFEGGKASTLWVFLPRSSRACVSHLRSIQYRVTFCTCSRHRKTENRFAVHAPMLDSVNYSPSWIAKDCRYFSKTPNPIYRFYLLRYVLLIYSAFFRLSRYHARLCNAVSFYLSIWPFGFFIIVFSPCFVRSS